jgi:hypothetical protein
VARTRRLDRPQHRLGHEHHAGAAAEGPVVHDAVAPLAELAQVHEVDADEAPAHRPAEDGLPQEAFEQLGEEGDDGRVHGGDRAWILSRTPCSPAS